MAGRPRVFTIPASAPFLPTLIEALIAGRVIPGFPDRSDPLALAAATLYLPTRRACRLARSLFLDALAGDGEGAVLLPRLAPVGDVDEDELIFAEAGAALAAEDLDLPPALDDLERRLMLARLILAWAQSRQMRPGGGASLVASGPPAALALAADLARLIDDMVTRGVDWSRLDGLVPDHVDVYWQLTLDFLKIARQHWPALLAERGAIEAAERRDRLIAAETRRLQAAVGGPVIAAGSTASMPATARLLSTIARLPQGAVVLPGLDTWLDEASWGLLGAGEGGRGGAVVHPQFAMHGFLENLGLHREEVAALAAPRLAERERLVSEALRPAAATHLWRERLATVAPSGDGGDVLVGLTVMEAAHPEEEALAIAVALRETAEQPGRVAALVTPDRALARRVIAALARWHVAVDDSGGDALADTAAGVFARLTAEVALEGTEPVPLLALLKHPLCALCALGDEAGRARSALERAVLRGPRPRPGTAGLVGALAAFEVLRGEFHPADPRMALRDGERAAAARLVERLGAALAPFEALASGLHSLGEFAQRHAAALAALTGIDAATAADSHDELDGLFRLLARLQSSEAAAALPVSAADYGDIFETAMAGEVVRGRPDPRASVRVFGLLEARLQPVHRVVLGGLVEGIWPPETRSDPWLSRPMRQELGLDLPERRIGLTAHDFAQGLGAPEVFLSRAAKVGGAPTVPSRFVQRLAAVAGAEAFAAARARGETYLAMARRLDEAASVNPVPPPAPRPPLSARPTRLSVTEIEHLLRDPYTIYARRILRLAPLDPIDTPPGPRDRGSAVHAAIEEFSKKFAAGLPPDPLAALMEIGRQHFAPLADFPEAQAFWWPRFERIAGWFAEWDSERRDDVSEVLAELRGSVEIATAAGPVTLAARADRIERRADGSFALLDFKTGQVPTGKQVLAGLAPQLTLEAAILRGGGFAGIPAGASVAELSYVSLRGGDPPGELATVKLTDTSADAEADKALARLTDVLTRFADVTTAYPALLHPMWRTRYGDYDHLARVKEWSLTGGAAEAAGNGEGG